MGQRSGRSTRCRRLTDTFRDFVDGGFGDPSAVGYLFPKGAGQLNTLPWNNANEVAIQFNEDVGATVAGNPAAFDLVNRQNSFGSTGTGLGVPPNVTAVSWNLATLTATLTLDGVIDSSVFELTIDSSMVTNAAGDLLDGETGFVSGVSDGVLTGNSGDGVEGGDFAFTVLALPGDSRDLSPGDDSDGSVWDNGPWAVNSTDRDYTNSLQNSFLFDDLSVPFQGPVGGYDARADYNGDHVINSTDANFDTLRQNTFIIFTGPSMAPVDDADDSSDLASVAVTFTEELDADTTLELNSRVEWMAPEEVEIAQTTTAAVDDVMADAVDDLFGSSFDDDGWL